MSPNIWMFGLKYVKHLMNNGVQCSAGSFSSYGRANGPSRVSMTKLPLLHSQIVPPGTNLILLVPLLPC